MKRLIVLLLTLLMFLPTAMAGSVSDNAKTEIIIIPDIAEWEMTRTQFKNEHTDVTFSTITVGDYKALFKAGFQIEGYTMDGYYEFTIPVKNSYGLSRVVYILDVTKKLSNAKLNTCYNTLVKSVSSDEKPESSTDTETVWVSNGATMRVAIGAMTEYNGSKNKAVYISFEPGEAKSTSKPTNTPKSGKSSELKVHVDATCSDYNHVGYDWEIVYSLNGKEIGTDSRIKLQEGDIITVSARITEKDKYPDEGNGGNSYTVTAKDIQKGFSLTFIVSVKEGNGRYSGCEAVWHVTFSFAP